MSNVLRAKKDSFGEALQKHARLDQTRDRLEPKATDRLYLLIHLAQLRNTIGRETQTPQCGKIFSAGVFLMRRLQCRPDCAPHLMLFARVRRIGNFIARQVIHRELRDLISSRAIFLITKARMIRIELYDGVSIRDLLISDHGSAINVIRE